MKDEIKEILKILKKCEFGACITKHDSRVLLDYITNLQKENKELNNVIIKTIKYLEECQESLEEWHFDGYDPQLDIIINELKENNI